MPERSEVGEVLQFEYDVAIVGLGYVGLPTALAYFAGDTKVLAYDISERRVSAIRSGKVDLLTSDHERLTQAMGSDRFEITTDANLLTKAAAVVLCVPTPVDEHLMPDLSMLKSACESIVAVAVKGQMIMLTSTTYAGTTRDFVVTPFEERGLVVGEDVFVTFSAERIDPGNSHVAQELVPRVIGGATPACEDKGADLLQNYANSVHRVPSLEVAEMSKLLENTFRAVNIALANEFAVICEGLGMPVEEVIAAAATKPYGFMPFYPGPGVGGHCIPCDPHYLLWQLRKEHIAAPMITQAMTQIDARPTHVVDRVRSILSDAGSGIRGARVLVVGVAYKPNVEDVRESPAIRIIDELDQLGADVSYLDRRIPALGLPSGAVKNSIEDPAAFDADLVLVHTRHSDQDFSWLADSTIVVDATYRGTDLPNRVAL